jgi:hypothetical protein
LWRCGGKVVPASQNAWFSPDEIKPEDVESESSIESGPSGKVLVKLIPLDYGFESLSSPTDTLTVRFDRTGLKG